jgi:cytoskeletal protein CcmA (bactofilin family)
VLSVHSEFHSVFLSKAQSQSLRCFDRSSNQRKEEITMALWKETAQQKVMPSEPSEKIGRVEAAPMPAPTPVNPTPPRESTQMDRQESFLGSGVTIEGKMEGNGDVRIAGKFNGDIQIKGNLNIQKGAHLTAKINAEAITIEGELEGTVVASGQITLAESGQVIGDLKAKTLAVAAGSRMRGNVEFGWNDSETVKLSSVPSHEIGKNT